MSANAPSAMVHANALLIGAAGVLLRGASGAGKSALTLDLIDHAQARGHFARLVGDDRIELVNRHGRLVARPHPALAGRIEIRGRGVVRAPHEGAGVIRLIVELFEHDRLPERCPEKDELETQLCGVTLPLLFESASAASAPGRIISFIHELVTK
jgi:serine kinase of HPr protein (carbohydrate metabolism regulator)